MNLYWVILTSWIFLGCNRYENLGQSVDQFLFTRIGQTIFKKPKVVTIKELRLDITQEVGKEIIIEGVVEERGEMGTYLVLADDAARVLVITTDLETEKLGIEADKRRVKVLGQLETGKKGLPYVRAFAFRNIAERSTLSDTKIN